MQRWMAAKMQLAKRNGITVSGAGRALGDVWDDRTVGPDKKPNRGFMPISDPGPIERQRNRDGGVVFMKVSPIKRQPRGVSVVMVAPENRPTAWGKGRRHRRALA